MMLAPSRPVLIAAALMFLTGLAGAQTEVASRFAGFWKLSVSRSKIAGSSGDGYFNYRQYEPRADGLVAHTMIRGDATRGDFLFTVARYDGKEYPVYDSRSLAAFLAAGTKPDLTVTFKRLDDSTIEYTDRVKGRIASGGPCAVSRDGTTLTIVSHTFDAEGRERSVSTLVYERQN